MLSDEEWSVIGADSRRLPFGLHSRCAPPYELLDEPDSTDFVDGLRRVIQKHRPDVLLPIGAAREVSQAREILYGSTKILVPDIDTLTSVDDKRLVVEQCRMDGIRCPDLLDFDGARNLIRAGAVDAVVVKPRFNLGGGTGVAIVTDAQMLADVVERTENQFGETLITEFVPGPDSANIALHVLFDRDSRPIGHFVMRKLRLQPARVGITAMGLSEHRPELLQSVLPLFARLRWQGPADVEFKLDSRTGKAYLIEVNARFSGAVGFAISCGINLPLLNCKAALDETLPESTVPEYRANQKYWDPIMYARAIATAAVSRPNPLRLPGQILGELRGKRVGNPYLFTDPAPFIGKGLYELRTRLFGTRAQTKAKRANL